MNTFRFFFVMLLAALCLPQAAEARRPRGTAVSGVVVQVDHSTRSLVLQQPDGSTRQLVYATRARFSQGGAEAAPSALRKGMHVQVSLHQPIIGPDYATQIELVSAEAGGKAAK